MPSRERRLGTWLARPGGMKKLQARFHPPFAEGRAYIVVGHVVEEAGETESSRGSRRATLGRHDAPATILATLGTWWRHEAPIAQRLGSLRSRLLVLRAALGATRSDVQDA